MEVMETFIQQTFYDFHELQWREVIPSFPLWTTTIGCGSKTPNCTSFLYSYLSGIFYSVWILLHQWGIWSYNVKNSIGGKLHLDVVVRNQRANVSFHRLTKCFISALLSLISMLKYTEKHLKSYSLTNVSRVSSKHWVFGILITAKIS